MNLAEMIKHYRLKAGLTQEDLGRYLSYSAGAVSNYEKGIRTPDVPTMKKIAEALDIPLNLLIEANLAQASGFGESGLSKEEYASSLRQMEKEVVDAFRAFDDSDKKAVQNYVRKLRRKNPGPGSGRNN